MRTRSRAGALPSRSDAATGGVRFGHSPPLNSSHSQLSSPFLPRWMPSTTARLVRVAPADDLNQLIGFEILVVREEMLDLLDRDRRQVRVVVYMCVALGKLCRRHGQQLLLAAGFVLHQQNADHPAAHDRAGNDPACVGADPAARVVVDTVWGMKP